MTELDLEPDPHVTMLAPVCKGLSSEPGNYQPGIFSCACFQRTISFGLVDSLNLGEGHRELQGSHVLGLRLVGICYCPDRPWSAWLISCLPCSDSAPPLHRLALCRTCHSLPVSVFLAFLLQNDQIYPVHTTLAGPFP